MSFREWLYELIDRSFGIIPDIPPNTGEFIWEMLQLLVTIILIYKLEERRLERKYMRRSTGLFDINGQEIFEGDLVQRSQSGKIIGSGRVCWGVYNFSHCDEYSCEHYGWYIDFVAVGYTGDNTGYPLWINSHSTNEQNEIIEDGEGREGNGQETDRWYD